MFGLLNFACKAIAPGRAFLRRDYNLTAGLSKPYDHIRISKEAKADFQAWLSFLSHFNGKCLLLNYAWPPTQTFEVYSDSAANYGFAAVWGTKWFNGHWPDHWKDYNIAFLEFFPIVVALEVWHKLWANKCIVFFTDNKAVMYIINNQTCKDESIMSLVRRLVIITLKHNILVKSCHIEGVKNTVPDLLSRLQVGQARRIARHLDEIPEHLPLHLLTQHYNPPTYW